MQVTAGKPVTAEVEERIEKLDPLDGLRLERPAEPVEMRLELRAGALGSPVDDRSTYPASFGAWIWERWRGELEPAGLSREDFMEIVAGYRRELWFWLLGDRGWEQVTSGLAGRVSRRIS